MQAKIDSQLRGFKGDLMSASLFNVGPSQITLIPTSAAVAVIIKVPASSYNLKDKVRINAIFESCGIKINWENQAQHPRFNFPIEKLQSLLDAVDLVRGKKTPEKRHYEPIVPGNDFRSEKKDHAADDQTNSTSNSPRF